jgi:hypothetical protein
MVSKQQQAGRQPQGAAGAGQGVTRLDGDQQPRRQRLGLDVLPGYAVSMCGWRGGGIGVIDRGRLRRQG